MARKDPLPKLLPVDYLTAEADPSFMKFVGTIKTDTHYNLCNVTNKFSNTINKIRLKYTFTKLDVNELESFTAGIDNFLNCDNFLSVFKQKYIDLPSIFNQIIKASDFSSLPKLSDGNLQKHFLYLFSIVKHCQEPDKYPIGYKFWMNLNDYYFNSGKNNYDELCSRYNTIVPSSNGPKHVFFAAYLDKLARDLANALAPNITRYAKNDIESIFNIKDYDSIMGVTRDKNKVILPAAPPQSVTTMNGTITTSTQSTTLDYPRHPLNLILYGPPGTGKTYNTLFKALEIIEGKTREDLDKEKNEQDEKWKKDTKNPKIEKKGYEVLKGRYDEYIKKGQIVFTTFHQSMSYEDFIEEIKPIPVEGEIIAKHENDSSKSKDPQFGNGTTTIANLSRMKYEVRDGMFKDLCNRTLDFNIAYKWLKDDVSSKRKGNANGYSLSVSTSGIVLVDGKSVSEENLKLYYDYFQEKGWGECENNKTNKEWWDNKIAELTENKTEHVDYTYYYALLSELRNTRFILIIDEINRGNVAQIFGELITLIEPNKRLGNSEEMKAILPYSSAQKGTSVYFGVPNNLYIIGTMNTADRSVEALDTALRRRFSFEEMMPKPELLTKIELTKGDPTSAIDLKEVLEKINDRIIVLKDREHQIGHSYFMGHDDKNEDGSDKYQNKKEWLTNVFKDKIIPLLQEYFYGDYKKIYYVLGGSETEGEGFVKIDSVKSDIFAVKIDDFEYDIPEKRYEIQKIDDTFDIDRAIKVLLGTE